MHHLSQNGWVALGSWWAHSCICRSSTVSPPIYPCLRKLNRGISTPYVSCHLLAWAWSPVTMAEVQQSQPNNSILKTLLVSYLLTSRWLEQAKWTNTGCPLMSRHKKIICQRRIGVNNKIYPICLINIIFLGEHVSKISYS